jgi:hypothetical protein
LTSARGLFLREYDQTIIGGRRRGPCRQVVCASNPVPDRDPLADPLRPQRVLDLVRAES